jgi:mono/diheme cytochrome c family protein
MTHRFRWCAWSACLWLGLAIAPSGGSAQESQTGLLGTYSSGATTVSRWDRQVAFDWEGLAPDPRLDSGAFAVTWSGTLVTPLPGEFLFAVFTQGRVSLRIDGRQVLAGERANPGWIVGSAVGLSGQDVPLSLEFTKTGPQASVRLFWSGPGFPLEPLPGRALESAAAAADEDLVPRGAELVAALGCRSCHDFGPRPRDSLAPPLTHRQTGLQPGWVERHLSGTATETERNRMPTFGLDRQDARDIASFLRTTRAAELPPVPPVDAGVDSVARGNELIRSLGCLACHTWREAKGESSERQGIDFLWGGGALDRVAEKLTPEAIARQLTAPEQWNPHHQMPRFELSNDEVAALVAALTTDAAVAQSTEAGGDPRRGRQLVTQHHCANCHRLNDEGPESAAPPRRPWKPTELTSPQSCLTWQAGGPARPRYHLAEADRRAIIEFFESAREHTDEVSGGTLLMRRGCLNCHPRDGSEGLRPVVARLLAGTAGAATRGEGWLPPDLTAVGDKLQDGWLSRAVAGEQPRRLPWLNVRMPRFRHSDEERQVLVRHFIQHDRIPADGPGAAAPLPTEPTSEISAADWNRAGIALGGARGFSCVGCHKVGMFEPRGVALSTRGSDLHRIDQRMRPEFFLRWVRGPIRIIPNMEMPAFVRPAPGVLHERLDHQLGALWNALSQAKPPPFDTSSVEQELRPIRGGPPKLVRDVFNLGDPLNSVMIPRALAVGFAQPGHLVFDLDALALRGWWSGAFARQRASGKSWYWEPSGSMVEVIPAATVGAEPDVRLQWPGQPPSVATRQHGRAGRVTSYRTTPDALELHYELNFTAEDRLVPVHVTEVIRPAAPADSGGATGVIHREFMVRGVPDSVRTLVRTVNRSDESGWVVRDVRLDRGESGHSGVVTVHVAAGDLAAVDPAGAAAAAPSVAGEAVPLEPRVELDAVPGFEAVRLPLPVAIMPTSVAFLADGTLAFTSLKGQVYLARDTNADGLPDRLVLVEEGLAAPFGLLADGNDLLVAHKPEVLRLGDFDGAGLAGRRTIVADGWGYTDDYHDWTTGIVRDDAGRLYIGLGSDYAKAGRTTDQGRWRGKVLRIDPDGAITPVGHEFRYPIGLARNAAGDIFVTDNQGVQNPFNELNHLVTGARYGVPSLFEEPHEQPPQPPAIQIPHPWTRSVNGIFPLTAGPHESFGGQLVGCEYDTRFLVRMSLEQVDGVYQGGIYPLSLPANRMLSGTQAEASAGPPGPSVRRGFLGVLCGAQAPGGDLYIGGIHDSGWNGGPNVGEIVRLRRRGELPAGIERISATPTGFEVRFTQPVDAKLAGEVSHYAISGVTRRWTSGYATPDSGQHRLVVERVELSADGRQASLVTTGRQPGHVYEFKLDGLRSAAGQPLWPAVGFYTLHRVPGAPR